MSFQPLGKSAFIQGPSQTTILFDVDLDSMGDDLKSKDEVC